MIVLLALAAGALAWWRLAPYDPEAHAGGLRITSVRVTRDYQFRWLDINLQASGGQAAPQPIALAGQSGWRLAPAAITTGRDGPAVRFWLEEQQLQEPLVLTVGPDQLRVKPAGHAPELTDGQSRTFRSLAW